MRSASSSEAQRDRAHPSSENLPGPKAMKPGDILRAMNGKTIEVINTDAEDE